MAEPVTFDHVQALRMLPQTKLQHVLEEFGESLVISTMPTQQMLDLIDCENCTFELSPEKFIDLKYPLKIISPDRERPLYVYIE